MSTPSFVITQAGLTAAQAASPTGPYVNITEFRVGAGYNYTPALGDTALHGATLHSGVPFSYNIISADTLDILLVMDTDIGTFNFGEIGLYMPGGVLFALAAFSSLQEKTKAIGDQIGSRWTFHTLLRLAQAPSIIQVNTTNSANLLEVADWSLVLPPADMLSDSNAIVVHTPDPYGNHPLAVKSSDDSWSILSYPRLATGTITASTTGSFTSGVFSTIPPRTYSPNLYLARFVDTGLIRPITALSGNIATIAPTLSPAPTGDVEILCAITPDPIANQQARLDALLYSIVFGS